ncbi:MAG: MotA/TolQ/ExbB proton channel family protein [Kiritimatiellae bacterium]|jgi:biopolymer transport protein ExbB|nr:MotA/TolQ/ExbB proton channel family protein [Kiritimatiellia bacterium]
MIENIHILIAQAATANPSDLFQKAFDLLERGGPVMWPILACSLMGVTVAFERLFAFWNYNTANMYFKKRTLKLLEQIKEGQFNEALESSSKLQSPVSCIITEALQNSDTGFCETLQSASQRELNKLKRGFSVLDTVITVAPMLGILGTVTGIIGTFNALNTSAMGNPTAATAGIGEALITTATGLVVAIICIFPFNYLTSQLTRCATELEQIMHKFEVAYNSGRMSTKLKE